MTMNAQLETIDSIDLDSTTGGKSIRELVGGAAGAAVGTVVGGAVGSLAGPLGTTMGGAAGAYVGGEVGSDLAKGKEHSLTPIQKHC